MWSLFIEACRREISRARLVSWREPLPRVRRRGGKLSRAAGVVEGNTPSFLGATLLENPRGSLCNRRDACDKKYLREPAKLLGRVWEDKRYTGCTARPAKYPRRKQPESREVSRSCQLRSYQRREGDLF